MNILDHLLTVVDRIASAFCNVLLVVIVAVTLAQVGLRTWGRPTSWSEELALLLLIWFGMISVAVAVRSHGHIAISALRDRMPAGLARWVDIQAQVLVLVFSLVLFVKGFDLVALTGVQLFPALGIPRAWLYYPVVIGGFLMSVNALGNLILGRVSAPEPETMP